MVKYIMAALHCLFFLGSLIWRGAAALGVLLGLGVSRVLLQGGLARHRVLQPHLALLGAVLRRELCATSPPNPGDG